MSVQTFNPTDLSQGTANWAVAQRIVGPFAPHAQVSPDLTIALDPGYLLNGTTLTEVTAQIIGPFAPPASGFRIDRVVVDRTTGAAGAVVGTANSLTPPAIPSGKLPVARVFLDSTTLKIDNNAIVDERAFNDLTTPPGSRAVCRAHMNGTNQTIPVNTHTKVAFTNVDFNIGGAYNTTNQRFQPSVPGHYEIYAQAWMLASAGGAGMQLTIFKNGVEDASKLVTASVYSWMSVDVTNILHFDGASDYVEINVYQSNSTSAALVGVTTKTFLLANRVY